MDMSSKTRVSYSLSEEVVAEIEDRRGLVKKSTYVEDLLRKALGLEIEEGRPSRPIARSVR